MDKNIEEYIRIVQSCIKNNTYMNGNLYNPMLSVIHYTKDLHPPETLVHLAKSILEQYAELEKILLKKTLVDAGAENRYAYLHSKQDIIDALHRHEINGPTAQSLIDAMNYLREHEFKKEESNLAKLRMDFYKKWLEFLLSLTKS